MLLILLTLGLLHSCSATRAIYGVPIEEWEKMSHAEKQAAKEQFARQQAIYEQTRQQAEATRQSVEETRKAAEAFEKKCLEQEVYAPYECRVITRRRFGF